MRIAQRQLVYVIFVCYAVTLLTNGQNITNPPNATDDHPHETAVTEVATTPSIEDQWMILEKATKRLVAKGIKALLPSVMESPSTTSGISPSCTREVFKLIAGLRQLKTWAFSFIDASGKTIDGMLFGTMAALGDYDQCVRTKAIEEKRGKNYGKAMFTGKYCTIDIKPPLPPKKHFYKLTDTLDELKNFSMRNTVIAEAAKTAHFFYLLNMRYGICVPSGCQEADISHVADQISERSGLSLKVRSCEMEQKKDYSPSVIAVMTVCSFLGLLVLVGSVIDIVCFYRGRKITRLPLQVLVAFSFISNFKKLVNTHVSSENLKCLSGLRVLSMTWIILGHTYLIINFQLFRQLKFVREFSQDFAFSAIVNATVAVDTFFVMGGFLVCYLAVKIIRETKKPFNIGLYIFHRIFRILPLYSMIVAFVFLLPLFGYGPVWHDTVDNFGHACRKNWWSNFFFINNYFPADQMCLPQSWYIASDMQLYIAALIILLPLFRWPKVGLSIAVLGILASMISSGTITYVWDFPPTMLFIHPDHDQRIDYWSTTYFKPYSHAGPYCVGMILGYYLAVKPNLRLPLRVRIAGWCTAIAFNLAVLYGVSEWNAGRDPTLIETILYSSCHRVAWALGVAWVILSCAIGQGGVVNYILSWKCWTVLARLTYGAYLIHPIVQITAVGNVRMHLMPWHYFAVWMYFGHLFITYGCAFAATMLVEAPFMSLEKIIFRKQIDSLKKSSHVKDCEANGGLENTEHNPTVISKEQNSNGNGLAFAESGVPNKVFLDDSGRISRL